MYDLTEREHISVEWRECLREPPLSNTSSPKHVVSLLTLCFKHLACEAHPGAEWEMCRASILQCRLIVL